MPLDNEITRKLILAKNFYLRAELNFDKLTAIELMVAVHHYHISIEITLRAIASKYNIEANNNVGFDELIGVIKSSDEFNSNGRKIPYHDQIKTINKRRNDVQHSASEPSIQNVRESSVFTYRFLVETFDNLFAVSFEAVNEYSLIDNLLLRRFLNVASRLLAAEDFVNAYGVAGAAFEWANCYIQHIESTIFPNFDHGHLEGNINTNDYANNDMRLLLEQLEYLGQQVEKNTDTIQLMSSGLDMADYTKYLRHRPHIAKSMGGGVVSIQPQIHVELTEESTRFALNFVTSSILKWQNLGTDEKLISISNQANAYLDKMSVLADSTNDP